MPPAEKIAFSPFGHDLKGLRVPRGSPAASMSAGAFRSKVEDLYRAFVTLGKPDAAQGELRRMLRPADMPRAAPSAAHSFGPPSNTTQLFGTDPQSSTPIFGRPPTFGPSTGG